MDDSESCKYMSNEDLVERFKNFSGLTATQENIRLVPEQKNKIRAFTQWVNDQFRLGIDPNTLPFPQADIVELLIQAKTHQLSVSTSYTISKVAKPVRLSKTFKWRDWAPTFMNM